MMISSIPGAWAGFRRHSSMLVRGLWFGLMVAPLPSAVSTSAGVIRAQGPGAVASGAVEVDAVEGELEFDFEHAARNNSADAATNRAIKNNLRKAEERSTADGVMVM
jgi:hypothetical protein